MLFNNGMYKHESGFMVLVNSDIVMLTPDAPMSMRIEDIFDSRKWEQVTENSVADKTVKTVAKIKAGEI